uniref:Ig-like domain-containing protein n=1 Tax=Pygocentrus nattereri TaxID=42514 RepID=A0AAR2JWD4_PYGNA
FVWSPIYPCWLIDPGPLKTLKNLAVKHGGSLTIPCFYDEKYKSDRKYWCKVQEWLLCKIVASTNTSGRTSVTDHPTQNMFTVEVKSLQDADSGYYWCSVEISDGSDDGDYVYLTVSSGKTFTVTSLVMKKMFTPLILWVCRRVMLAGTGSVQEMWGLLFTSLSLKDLQVRSHVSEILFIPADHQAVMLFHSHHFVSSSLMLPTVVTTSLSSQETQESVNTPGTVTHARLIGAWTPSSYHLSTYIKYLGGRV